MNKIELVREISKSTGFSQKNVTKMLNAFADSVRKTMGKSQNVYLRGFGSFVVKERAPRKARNFQDQSIFVIPAHNSAVFNPSGVLKAEVKEIKVGKE